MYLSVACIKRRWETRCRPLVYNEILKKSRLYKNEIYKGEFCTSRDSSKIIKTSSSSSVSCIHSIIAVITLKSRKKPYASTKTTKTKYQTSLGQNSPSSSISFTDLKLSTVHKKSNSFDVHHNNNISQTCKTNNKY